MSHIRCGAPTDAAFRCDRAAGDDEHAECPSLPDALFVQSYKAEYPEAVKCLSKDRVVWLAFYDFPAEQWMHIRTTNPIESIFATVRLRTKRTQGSGFRVACLTNAFKLTMCAQKTSRSLNGSPLLADVIRGVQFVDGTRSEAA